MVAERSRDVTTPRLPSAGRRAAVGMNRVATFSRAMNLPPLGGSRSKIMLPAEPLLCVSQMLVVRATAVEFSSDPSRIETPS